jgi:hypothetical protein
VRSSAVPASHLGHRLVAFLSTSLASATSPLARHSMLLYAYLAAACNR